MKPILGKIIAGASVAGASVIAFGLLCQVAGARVNTSKSIRVGLYWTSNGQVGKGAYVLFCPPPVPVIASAKRRGYLPAGFCPGDYGYMMKRVAATQGDRITIADDGVRVNGELLPFSAPLAQDGAGRALQRYRAAQFVVTNTEVLLMSDVSATSFDGRYFGPVRRSQIQSVIVPILTW